MKNWFRENVLYGPAFQAAQIEEKALPLSPECASLDGRTLLFMSDIHLSHHFPRPSAEKLLGQVESLKPDLLLLGGDYAESAAWQKEFFEMIGQLSAPLGIYAVLGNNDCECFPDGLIPLFKMTEKAGVTLLADRTARIDTGRGMISIAGLDEYRQAKPLRKPLLTGRDASGYRILLAHYPHSIMRYHQQGFPLQAHLALAGHTHGGQFRLLGMTPYSLGFERYYRHPLPAFTGWTPVGEANLLVSNGLGTSRIPLRVGVPPQIHLLRLTNQSPK